MAFRSLLAFFFVSILYLSAEAQTVYPDHLDGVVYAEKDSASSLQLDPYIQGSNAYLDSLIVEHNVDTIAGTLTSLSRFYRVEFSDSSEVDQLLQGLRNSSVFSRAEKMPYFETSHDPNDPSYSQQWYLQKVEAPNAWDSTKGDSTIEIGVVDNAVSTQHEDLSGALWVNEDEMDGNGIDDDLNGYPDDKHGYDVADSDGDPNPPSSSGPNSSWVHGTHVGGVAGASTDNGKGMASLGYQARVIAVKCSQSSSNGSALTHAYEGVDYAMQAGADVINMSFGSSSGNMVGDALLQQARNQGITLVGAAGNSDTTEKHYPAAYTEVIAVGATNSNDERAYFSNYGSWIDVMAPGTNILSTLSGNNGDEYGELQGTSMATPVVSGIASLILSVEPGFSPKEVEETLENTADDISNENPNYDGQLGSGRVNAYLAVRSALGMEPLEEVENELRVQPQPSNGRFELMGIPEDAEQFKLTDQRGKLWREGTLEPPYQRFNFSDLSDGVYCIKISGKDLSVTKKLLIRSRR